MLLMFMLMLPGCSCCNYGSSLGERVQTSSTSKWGSRELSPFRYPGTHRQLGAAPRLQVAR